MKFRMEQIALCPRDPAAAKRLLTEMGATEWAEDIVEAVGNVFQRFGKNKAELSFNYEMLQGKELEILHYTQGDNWMALREPRVSHLGMHCTQEELVDWRSFFAKRGYQVAQEVNTRSHTNPVIAGKREYHYVIFDTYRTLGVDIKFIVRRNLCG